MHEIDTKMICTITQLAGHAPPPPALKLPRRVHTLPIAVGDPVALQWEQGPEHRRTRRWTADEFLLVDGMPVVYSATTAAGIVAVHMPGQQRPVTLGELAAQGRTIVMPPHLRTDE